MASGEKGGGKSVWREEGDGDRCHQYNRGVSIYVIVDGNAQAPLCNIAFSFP